MHEQRQDLGRGCDVLIATPGRLEDMFNRGNISLELIQFFILDEADRMLDMGFEPQVRQIVESTNMGKSSQFPRQSMMFSATFAREVQRMASDFLHDYVFITVGRVGSASELIKQEVVYAGELKQKIRALEKAINDHLPRDGLAVVFVETKKSADTLEMELLDNGVPVCAIHGDRSQTEREEALHAFKTGANPVLVATDVAARGLDIPNVALVVNFDMPKQIDDYVHRIGRTGRAGRKGVAIAFVNERCNYLAELGDLLVEAKQDPPLWFNELCRSAEKRPGFGGKGGRNNRFGGQDLRLEGNSDLDSKATTTATKPTSSWAQPAARGPNSYGSSGLEDAW
jgi:ATP-dependent RNA helicase DDX3X